MAASKTSGTTNGRSDLFFALGLVVASVGAGYAINAFRAQPLPFRYGTKAERLEQSVDAIAPQAKVPGSPSLKSLGAVLDPARTEADLSLDEFIAYT